MRLSALLLPGLLLSLAPLPLPLAAQAWNENGPTRDIWSGSTSQFDRLRSVELENSSRYIDALPRGAQPAPIPMLDWQPPPPVAAAPPAPAPRRRVVRRAAPQPAPAQQAQVSGTETVVDKRELERMLADRERLLDQLRQQLEIDKRAVQQARTIQGGRIVNNGPVLGQGAGQTQSPAQAPAQPPMPGMQRAP
ncbi:hypothetical protein IAI18_07315 [Acetobacteraceae bacterium H6797]|nr:hypothetical protein [Acetobacteraceae bacterium H6797]